MATAVQKITLSSSRDIPFNKLVLSQANVRRIKAGVSIEVLAEDIARRTLLQSITVRPVLDELGAETGMFEIPAGGRRYRALELLVKQKRLARNVPIPCVVRTEGTPEEDSLAENVQRAPLHPLDQFRAFLALREKGQSEEEIAAAFFVGVNVVKQRLRLASVSPKLLDVYADDGMTLDQLMGFTVSSDHERQEQVWDAIQRSYNKEAYQIRRLLTEGAVRASDKRAQYVGEEYIAAGGAVMRDLLPLAHAGFGQEVREALSARIDHLSVTGLAQRQGQRVIFARDLLGTLRRREFDAIGAKLAGETGLPYRPKAEGANIAGTYRQRLTLASGRFAMIDDGLGFQLVPWSPSLETKLGKHISGVMSPGGGVDWSFGRKRGLGI